MKKYKKDLQTIVEVILFILIIFSFSTINSPFISFVFLGLWIILWSVNLCSKIQYRKGNAVYMLIPTQNDQYLKTTSITLGIIIFSFSLISIFIFKTFTHYSIIGIVIGILVFLNGVFDLPKGIMKIEGNSIEVSGLSKPVDIRQLKEIKIDSKGIKFTNIYDETQRVNNLVIDIESSKLIEEYINRNNHNLELKIIINME